MTDMTNFPKVGVALDDALAGRIQPIETHYHDCKFRSRTEARWAVFQDHLHNPWEYEKDGYRLIDGVKYLCDFWLPRQQAWFEIKGPPPTGSEWKKAEDLAMVTGHPVYVAWGKCGLGWLPDVGIGACYPEGIRVMHHFWTEYDDGSLHIKFMGWLPRPAGHVPRSGVGTPRLIGAYRAAGEARFGT